MLKLLVRDVDICRLSKLLGKNKLKASITKSSIIIDSDEITDEVIDKLFENATIFSAQNYQTSDDTASMDSETKVEEKDTSVDDPLQEVETIGAAVDTVTGETVANASVVADDETRYAMTKKKFSIETPESVIEYSNQNIEQSYESIDYEYNAENSSNLVTQEDVEVEQLKISRHEIPEEEMLCRGEVYRWGNIHDKDDGEGKIKECVIIIQKDFQMSASEDTIVLYCTSNYEERAPFHFSFALTKKILVDYDMARLGLYEGATLFVSHIKGISRKQLGSYLGKINSSYMNKLQTAIDFCLGIKRSRTVNWAQIRMLSTINMVDLLEIAQSKVSDSEKVTELLKLFHFDITQNGMEYVKKSILLASKLSDYRLEDLVRKIAKKEPVEEEEVLRLIVARIKENFDFRKSPAISFIRLIDIILKKGY